MRGATAAMLRLLLRLLGLLLLLLSLIVWLLLASKVIAARGPVAACRTGVGKVVRTVWRVVVDRGEDVLRHGCLRSRGRVARRLLL